jgi:hypothetical protein
MAVDVSGLVSRCTTATAAPVPHAGSVLCDLAEEYAEQCRRKVLAHVELFILSWVPICQTQDSNSLPTVVIRKF